MISVIKYVKHTLHVVNNANRNIIIGIVIKFCRNFTLIYVTYIVSLLIILRYILCRYADDVVLIAASMEELQYLVDRVKIASEKAVYI